MVFVHGFDLGFNRIGIDSMGLDYWYQIPQGLAGNGATVFAAELSAVASNELRGKQLLMQVDEVLAITSARKLNLPGHRQGDPTIQYIQAIAPQKVASLTAIAGTMKGIPIIEKDAIVPCLNLG